MAARPQVARRILVHWMDGAVVLCGIVYSVNTASLAALGRLSPATALTVGLCMLGSLALLPWLLRVAFDGKPTPVAGIVLSGLLGAVALVLVIPGQESGGLPTWDTLIWFWLSITALFFPLRWSIVLVTPAILAVTSVHYLRAGEGWWWLLAYEAVTALLMIAAMRLWLWLWRTIREAHESKEAKARLAVAEERLRFSRDLHDLLGRSLVLLSLRSELAAKLGSPEEMRQVHDLAEQALHQLHATTTGLSSLDLADELAEARAALERAGADCLIEAQPAQLPAASRALLAWVVREGTTNILKHSRATHCHIRLDAGRLEIRNDGVRQAPAHRGSGLDGLAERISGAGGSLDAQRVGDDEFVLTATVPS